MTNYDPHPREGTLLGIVSIIHLIILLLGILGLMIKRQQITEDLTDTSIWIIFLSLALGFFIIVFNIFKGKRWAVLTYLVITILILINAISNIFGGGLIAIFINTAIIILQIVCLKHPYYQNEEN